MIRAVFTLFGQHIMCSNPDFLFLVALAFILVDQFFLAAILDIYSSMMAKVETPGYYMVVVSTYIEISSLTFWGCNSSAAVMM